MLKKRKRTRIAQKLLQKMGTFELIIPCLQGIYTCEITPKVVRGLQSEDAIQQNTKEWFSSNIGEIFEKDELFDIVETDISEMLDSESIEAIKRHVQIKNESILVRRISMLQMMQTKHYPNELSDFVQSVYARGEEDARETTPEESESALTFHQWVVCTASVDPKILPLSQVINVFNGKPFDKFWFHTEDLSKIRTIRDKHKTKFDGGEVTEFDVKQLPEFTEDLWNAHDPSDPERLCDIWWVEDIVSDVDLVHISGAAFNGPNPEDKPDLKPFSG